MKNSNVKYVYDYPDQREIAKDLYTDDKAVIAEKLGYSMKYVSSWCYGKRRNAAIMEMALKFQKINIRCRIYKDKIEVQK